jgi:hypothetical protein
MRALERVVDKRGGSWMLLVSFSLVPFRSPFQNAMFAWLTHTGRVSVGW